MKSQAKAWGQAVTREDGGQVAMGLVTCGLLALAALLMWFIVPVSAATDQSNRAQTAADAAALAAAKGLITGADTVLGIVPPGDDAAFQALLQGPYRMTGYASAQSYASQNDAHVTSYTYSPLRDRVTVSVRTDDQLKTGEQSEAEATAEIGMDWGSCTFTEKVPPTTPPYVIPDTLTCGSDTFDYLFFAAGNRTFSLTGLRQFQNLLEPRLVD